MEPAIVRGLVTEIESELLRILAGFGFAERDLLEIEGALSEPPVLGHALDQQVLGGSRRTMLCF